MVPSLPLLSCESLVSVIENPNRNKKDIPFRWNFSSWTFFWVKMGKTVWKSYLSNLQSCNESNFFFRFSLFWYPFHNSFLVSVAIYFMVWIKKEKKIWLPCPFYKRIRYWKRIVSVIITITIKIIMIIKTNNNSWNSDNDNKIVIRQ